MSSELLPAVLASVPPPPYPQRSLDAAKNDYGCELTTPSPPLRMLLRGCYPTADIMRWHQANQFVTSGANPGGGEAGFNDAHKQWSVRVREESVTLALTDTLSDVVVRESMVGISLWDVFRDDTRVCELCLTLSPFLTLCNAPQNSRLAYGATRRSEMATIARGFYASS
jgi:hypothetical protein